MKTFFVEGIYRPKSRSKSLEPFAKAVFANKPEEALKLATEMIAGGTWVDGPKVSEKTEEQRMQAMGAPMLPGFSSPALKKPATARSSPKKPSKKKPAPARPAVSKPTKSRG